MGMEQLIHLPFFRCTMSEITVAGGDSASETLPTDGGRRLVPMQVGDAVIYIEQIGPPPKVEGNAEIRAVSAPDPREVFEQASTALRECVRQVGEKLTAMADKVRPQQVTVEFSISFDAKGKSVIPVFFTGEAGVTTGLKVTALWKEPEPAKEKPQEPATR